MPAVPFHHVTRHGFDGSAFDLSRYPWSAA
jgi:hypothetical protein